MTNPDNPRQLTGANMPERNKLCPCGSRLKFKRCHGNELLRQKAKLVANQAMMELIKQEQAKAGICPNCCADLVEKECPKCGLKLLNPDELKKFMEEEEKAKQVIVPDKKIII